ncbi:MAG: hypothetical protein E7091_01505 [Bacteroidales bacterium]|nr:hypothetical protein [Bacteroidales bacterium]
MKKLFTGIMLFAAGLLAANAQQAQLATGDTFEYTNADGVLKQYKIVGENLIENPSFDNNTTGWVGGGGGNLTGVDWHNSGGIDGGAYLRLTESAGKGGNGSIGTAWEIEKGKTYVFSYFIRQNTSTDAVAKEGYIVTSETNTPRGDETKTIMYAYEDANCAWTQNIVVTTAEYKYLQFCARWLGGSKCFDAFILAEVEELANSQELEDLIAEAEEWMEVYDEPKDQDILQAIVDEANTLLEGDYEASDLNEMVHKLKEGLLDYRVVNASDEYPVDVTARYLKNPNFDNGLSDWTRTNDAVNNGSNIRFFQYFGEDSRVLEINGQPSKETHVSQTVYNLPLGYYRFTVQCVMNHTVDKASDPEAKSGAAIYCNGSELDMVTAEITTDGATKEASYPETFTIEGIVAADSIIVGFVGYPNTNFTYVAIDNVKLEYAGFDAGIYLESLIDDMDKYMSDNGDLLSAKLVADLETAIEEAEEAQDLEEEMMDAEYIRIQGVFTGVKDAVAKYQELVLFWETTFTDAIGECAEYPGIEDAVAVHDEISEFIENFIYNETAGYDEIVALMAKGEQAIIDLYLSQMKEASKENPANFTFLLPNANFEEKGNWVWNLTHNGGGSDLWVGNCRPTMEGGENRRGVNLWGHHIVSIDLHQELTGLPNGLYGISAEMITQGETADHGDYTTDQHLYVTGINTSVSENLPAPGGWDFYQWTTLTTGYVVVIDGTLTIGAASSQGGNASEGWFQATNFQLLYYGAASDEDLKVAFDATLAEAQTLLPNLLKGDAAVLQAKIDEAIALSATSYGEASASLQEPIAVAKAALAVYDNYQTGAYQAAIDAIAEYDAESEAAAVIAAAIELADAITAADTTTSAALASVAERLNAYVSYSNYLITVEEMLNDPYVNYPVTNKNEVKTVIALQKADLVAELQAAANVQDLQRKLEENVFCLEKSLYMNPEVGGDLTPLIQNPTFDNDASGWIVKLGAGNNPTNVGAHYGGDDANRYMDSWNGTVGKLDFAAMQILNDIPNGTYALKLAGRSDGDNVYAFALNEAITDTLINDSTVLKQVAASEATQWAMIPKYGNTYGQLWEADSIAYYVDQTMVDMSPILSANDGKGFGWSMITIENIVVTNHTMVIGVTTDSTVTKKVGFTGTWFSADDWSLTITEIGDNSNWVISGIDSAVASEVKSIQYYAIDGRQVAIPGKGIHIVKTIYSNGAIEIKKVLMK